MTTPLFTPPPLFALPLTKGGDLHVDFIYKAQYEIADYPDDAVVKLVIDTEPELTEVTATITGSRATIHLDYTAADLIKKGLLWRLILTTADGIDTVIVNGVTTRADGK